MVKPAVCNFPKKKYCFNYCCYIIEKKVKKREIKRLDLENLVENNGKYYLKSKTFPSFGPCVFLDEENRQCSIYSRRPQCCKSYDCITSPNPRNLIEEARYSRKKMGLDV